MRSDGFDVVYFGAVDWSHTWQRPQQIASRLAAQGRVIYVDPIGLRRLRLSDAPRLVRRLRGSDGHLPVAIPDGVSLISGHAATLASGLRAPSGWTARLIVSAVHRALEEAHIDRPVIWAGTPSPALVAALDRLPSRLLVYDCLDAVAAFRPGQPEVEAAEAALARRADVVLATTRELEARMRRWSTRTVLVPNAADYEHFSRSIAPAEIPDELRALPRPVVGYVGEVAEWFDTGLVRRLALRHPDWSIVLVGPVTAEARHALPDANIHVLGRRPYSELPRYLAGFDCCLIPFRASPLTAAVSPVKLYEYLAAGKPVVSTPLPSVLPFRREVLVGADRRFLEAVDEAVAGRHDAVAAEARRRCARAHTWDHRLASILGALHAAEAADPGAEGAEPARAAR
jgi:glycosyltransferase involved in cell wall biosynthesis